MYKYILYNIITLKQYSPYVQAQCRFLYIIQVLINKTKCWWDFEYNIKDNNFICYRVGPLVVGFDR